MYGHFTYAQMLAERRGLLREPGRLESGERVHLSLQRNPEPALDKKREPDRRDPKKRVNVRLFVPVPLKERLESIAERRRETLSQCTRNLLQHALLGVMF
jgi:hypothetical protein